MPLKKRVPPHLATVLLRNISRSDDSPMSVRKRLDLRQIGGVSRNLHGCRHRPYVRECSYYSIRKSRNEAQRAQRAKQRCHNPRGHR